MNKKLLLVCISMMVLTGCVDNDEPEKETMEYAKSNDTDEKLVPAYEDVVANVDFLKPHIQVELRDKFSVDADISTDVPVDLGVYEYIDNNRDNYDEEYIKEKEALVVKLIDEYYGEDVTITMDEAYANEQDNDVYEWNVSVGMKDVIYSADGINNIYFTGAIWESRFPDVKSDYDEAMIEGVIDEFVNHYKSLIPEGIKGIGGKYKCLHFDELFWKTEGVDAANYWGLSETKDKDYYWIRLYNEVEQGICCETGTPTLFVDRIGETSGSKDFDPGTSQEIHCGWTESYVDIYVDENGEIFAFDIQDMIEVGECAQVEEVLPVEDILGLVYGLYEKIPIYQPIVIKKVELSYMVLPANTVDEDGYRATHIMPIWTVSFTKNNGESGRQMIVFNGITGEIVYREV